MIKIVANKDFILIYNKNDVDMYFSDLEFVVGGRKILFEFLYDLLDIDLKLSTDVKKNIHPAYKVLIELDFGEDSDNNSAKIGMYNDEDIKITFEQQRMFDAYSEKYFKDFVYLEDRISNLQNQNI